MDIEGKVAIVTGSAAGMGRSTALMLAERECHVVVKCARSEEEACQTAADVEASGARALLVRADVSSDEQCRGMVEQAVGAFGRLDLLVNYAGATISCRTRIWTRSRMRCGTVAAVINLTIALAPVLLSAIDMLNGAMTG